MSPQKEEEPTPNKLSIRYRAQDSPRPKNDLNIHLGEHWAIVGNTGSGKTYFTIVGLLEYLRMHYPEAKRYILDSTGDDSIEQLVWAPLYVEGNQVPDLLRNPTYTMVWRPKNGKIPIQYYEWFEKLNDAREPMILVIDEVASITSIAEEALEGLVKQVRKHGGTVIILTQQIAKVDLTLFRQMTHFAQFFINQEPYDLARARSYLYQAKEDQRPPRYDFGFFYRKTRGNFAYKEYRDMKDFFRGR